MKRIAHAVALLVSLTAPAWTGFDEGLAAYDRGDYATALREWRPLGEQGNAVAQFFLGFIYDNGQGVRHDYAEAVKWYRRAAEQDHADAQNNLGFMYDRGRGVWQDYVQAHLWYNLAAARSNDTARRNRDIIAEKMTPAQIAEAQRLAREWYPKTEWAASRRDRDRLGRPRGANAKRGEAGANDHGQCEMAARGPGKPIPLAGAWPCPRRAVAKLHDGWCRGVPARRLPRG
jgi:hypothetical protein